MNATTFKLLRTIHRWGGLLFAPLILLFAFSGLLQTLEADEWKLPHWAAAALHAIQDAHQHQQLHGGTALHEFAEVVIVTMAAALMISTCIGVVMAYKMYPRRWPLTTLLLVVGLIVPLLALLV